MNRPMFPDNQGLQGSGFMPLAQGAALVEAASSADAALGPFVEVGSYGRKSAGYLGPIAKQLETVLFCVDQHLPERGSRDAEGGAVSRSGESDSLDGSSGDRRSDASSGRVADTAAAPSGPAEVGTSSLTAYGPFDNSTEFKQQRGAADLDDAVIAVVGSPDVVAKYWLQQLSLLFLNGRNSEEELQADYESWVGSVAVGGLLIIADVVVEPDDETQSSVLSYAPLVEPAEFEEVRVVESLRILRRTEPPT